MIIELYLLLVVMTFFFFLYSIYNATKSPEGKRKNPMGTLYFMLLAMIFFFTLGKASFNIEKVVCEDRLDYTRETYQYGDDYTAYHWDYASPGPQVSDVNLFHRNTTHDYINVCTTHQIIQSPMAAIFGMMGIFSAVLLVLYSLQIWQEESR